MTLKVLLVSAHHPELVSGGAQQACYELFQELCSRSDICPFLLASVDESHPALFKSGARITGFDGRCDEYIFLTRDYDYWWHKVCDPLLIESFAEFLQAIQPDVVHFHHFMGYGIDFVTLTRRVLPSCRIIFTFHEFLAICAANGHMVRRTDNSLCDRASQVRCHQCFPERSPEEFFVRKMWFMRHLGTVDQYTCPSRFMVEHYVKWGLPRERIAHISNGQRSYATGVPRQRASGTKNRFGFFGQFIDAKGPHILLRAVDILRGEKFTEFRVELNADNIRFASTAIRSELEAFLQAERERPSGEQIVVHNGPYKVDQLQARMSRIDWCVVPSVWWEAFGLVISEAWMFGKPVICSNVGGMAERVADDVNGLHFEMGDPRSLADVIRRACAEPGLWERLHGEVPAHPAREKMAESYAKLYRGEPALGHRETPVAAGLMK